ncbi:MAG: hypothetical protein H7332_00060 [Bdellovibrionales bacterium]|nr:hypothetical protein [Ramlibacter sp.]
MNSSTSGDSRPWQYAISPFHAPIMATIQMQRGYPLCHFSRESIAQLRQQIKNGQAQPVNAGYLTLDPADRSIWYAGGNKRVLSPQGFDFAYAMASQPGKLFTHELLTALFDYESRVTTKAARDQRVNLAVARLKMKLQGMRVALTSVYASGHVLEVT